MLLTRRGCVVWIAAIGFNLILIVLYVLPDESDASELSTLLITSTPLHQGVIDRSNGR